MLVVTDKPNGNVAFEAGLALGLRKPLSLFHFGSEKPNWLNHSLFKGFFVNSVQTLKDLRDKIATENSWFTPGISPALPDHGPTLFLAPTSFVGAALHELQQEKFRHWRKPQEASNFNDISHSLGDIAQAVWAISVYSDGNDIRDGAENAANALIAGWFYARAHAAQEDKRRIGLRLSILRQQGARPLVDVQVPEREFNNIEEFESLLSSVSDLRLPLPESMPSRDFTNGVIDYRMVKVPPVRSGEKSLWAGVFAVTNSQYHAFCKATDHPLPSHLQEGFEPNLPVVDVSPQDAQKFSNWAQLDLPTPEIWLHIALSGSNGKYWWGNDESVMELAAWFSTISENRLHEVGKLQPNKWGLYDILGNVWEWALYQEEDEDPNHNRILATKAEAFGGAFDTESSQLLFPRKRALSYKDQYTGFRCISRDGS